MDGPSVSAVRAFNRTVAERIGALNDGFLGRGRPMVESRTLWEIGLDGAEVRELRARLGLDSGYMSRVLRALERERLIKVETSPDDGRVRFARLTRTGRAERAVLDQRADRVAWCFLEPLTDQQRATLVAAMAEVGRLLRASLLSIAVEVPTTIDALCFFVQCFIELVLRLAVGSY